jgi:hypothetical protein
MVAGVRKDGGRNQQAVGGGVWAGGEVAERRRPGWWLPAAGPSPRWGRGVGEVREGGDVPAAGGRRARSRR